MPCNNGIRCYIVHINNNITHINNHISAVNESSEVAPTAVHCTLRVRMGIQQGYSTNNSPFRSDMLRIVYLGKRKHLAYLFLVLLILKVTFKHCFVCTV
ncbi:hypothetical protein BDN70DRAFT_297284 [Pholiota conissans]|uniref:Uncharacterized protein n=1 Tax=Pholiota conissans TaxID=109636 RepID=A0A9P5YSP3_9AGAR|nr:hypothetical protein BDN70DRAFT_297284 [Pholiota conissans]